MFYTDDDLIKARRAWKLRQEMAALTSVDYLIAPTYLAEARMRTWEEARKAEQAAYNFYNRVQLCIDPMETAR